MFFVFRRVRVGLILAPLLFLFLFPTLACGSSEPSTLDVLRQAFTPDPETEQVQRTVGPRDFEWLAYGHEARNSTNPLPAPTTSGSPRSGLHAGSAREHPTLHSGARPRHLPE